MNLVERAHLIVFKMQARIEYAVYLASDHNECLRQRKESAAANGLNSIKGAKRMHKL